MSEQNTREEDPDSSSEQSEKVRIPDVDFYENVTKIYEPISNPKRALILDMVRHGKTKEEISERFDMTRQGLQRHIDKLESSDLIRKDDDGNYVPTLLGLHAGKALDQAKIHHREYVKARVAERYAELAAEVETLASVQDMVSQKSEKTPDGIPQGGVPRPKQGPLEDAPAPRDQSPPEGPDVNSPDERHAELRDIRLRMEQTVSETVRAALEIYFDQLRQGEGEALQQEEMEELIDDYHPDAA